MLAKNACKFSSSSKIYRVIQCQVRSASPFLQSNIKLLLINPILLLAQNFNLQIVELEMMRRWTRRRREVADCKQALFPLLIDAILVLELFEYKITYLFEYNVITALLFSSFPSQKCVCEILRILVGMTHFENFMMRKICNFSSLQDCNFYVKSYINVSFKNVDFRR